MTHSHESLLTMAHNPSDGLTDKKRQRRVSRSGGERSIWRGIWIGSVSRRMRMVNGRCSFIARSNFGQQGGQQHSA